MNRKKLIIKVEPPDGILNGSCYKVYDKPRELELEVTAGGYLILKAIVEAMNHYFALTDEKPKYLVMGYEQYKRLIAEYHTYFKEPRGDGIFEEITLLGIDLKIVLLSVQIGIHISGEVRDVFEYCAQKELYP